MGINILNPLSGWLFVFVNTGKRVEEEAGGTETGLGNFLV